MKNEYQNEVFEIVIEEKHFAYRNGKNLYFIVNKLVDDDRYILLMYTDCTYKNVEYVIVSENKEIIEKQLNFHGVKAKIMPM